MTGKVLGVGGGLPRVVDVLAGGERLVVALLLGLLVVVLLLLLLGLRETLIVTVVVVVGGIEVRLLGKETDPESVVEKVWAA